MKHTGLLVVLFLLSSFISVNDFARIWRLNPEAALTIPCIPPTDQFSDFTISSLYGIRKHPISGNFRNHNGIDIAVSNANVIATARGVVEETGYSPQLGNYIKIKHRSGYTTRYGHLSAIFVGPGDKVEIASIIGKSGSTGLSTGEHIHYEVIKHQTPQNPLYYLTLLYDCLRGKY